MRRRLLFLIHFSCPAASPINQSGSRGQTGNESAHSPSTIRVYVCVRDSEMSRNGVLTCDRDKVNECLKENV